MNTLTVLPFLVAFFIGVAAMETNVYQICRQRVGTLEVEPWLNTAMAAVATALSFGWLARLMRSRTALIGAACLLALIVASLGQADAGVLLATAPLAVPAEPTLADVKTAIEASNRAFNEFKETNAVRLKAIEEGRAVDPLVTQKLDKLDAAIEQHSAANEKFIEKLQAQDAALNRLKLSGAGGADGEKRAARVELFNRSLRSHALVNGQAVPAELNADQVDAYCKAYDKYLRRGDRALGPDEIRALSVGTDPNGGWVVTPDLSGKIVMRVFETSPMRQYADAQTIGTDALEGHADLDEASFGWASELGTRSESNTPVVPSPYRIPVHEAYSQPRISQKLVEDANIDIVAWLAKKVGDKIGRGFNTAFVTGNGIGKPRGFASYTTAATADASRAWGVFEHVATGSSASFGTDPNGANKLLDLVHALKDVYASNAAFYMKRATLGTARKLTDASSAGHYLFVPSFVAGTPDTFLGYPVRKFEDMATIAADSLSVAFGDMKETYLIVDRLGITVLVDPYTAKPYIVYYSRARVGGDVVNFESLKFLKFGS